MKKSRTLKILGSIGIVLGIVLAVGMITRPNIDVRIEATTIEEAIAKKLPLSGTKLGVDWIVRDLDFSLLEDGRVRATPNVHLQVGRFDVDAAPTAIGRIVYDAGVVRVADLEVEAINPTSDAGATPSRAASILRSIVPDSWEQKSRDAAGDAIQKAFDLYPVYRLPDTGTMWWAKQSISKVTMGQDHVVVSIDPFGLLLRGLIYAGAMLLAVLGAIGFVVGMLSSRGGAAAGLAFIALD